jgi:hypothetical protein
MFNCLIEWINDYGYPRKYFIDLIDTEARDFHSYRNYSRVSDINNIIKDKELVHTYYIVGDDNYPFLVKINGINNYKVLDRYPSRHFINSVIKNTLLDNSINKEEEISVFMMIYLCYYYAFYRANNDLTAVELTEQVIAYIGTVIDTLIEKQYTTYKTHDNLPEIIDIVRIRLSFERMNIRGRRFNLRSMG